MKLLLADIGGSDIKHSLVENGEVQPVVRTPVKEKKALPLIEQLAEIAGDAEGIALSLPGTVAPSGSWSDSAAYDLMNKDINVRLVLKKLDAPPLRALAQDVFAAGRGAGLMYSEMDRFSVLNLGSGLGGAVVVSGWPWTGLAQEVGHLRLMERGRECFCGQIGCLEASAGWSAIRRRNPEFSSPYDLSEAALAGDDKAEAILKEAEEALAKAVAIVATTVLGQGVVLLGGTAEILFLESEKRLQALSERVRDFCISSVARSSPLLAGPGAEAPLIGLAALAGEKLSLQDFTKD